jgi:hypothetical protein
MFKTRRVAALAVAGAAVGALGFIHAPTAEATPKPPSYSVAGIGVFIFCDDGSPDSQPFGYNYSAITDASGHFTSAQGVTGWPGPDGGIIPAKTFYPRQFTREGSLVFAADPDQINPWLVTNNQAIPDYSIASGKIPKGKTLVSCWFGDYSAIGGPNESQLPVTSISGSVTGYTVPVK